MKRKPAPSDLSNAQWALLEPLMPEAKQNELAMTEANCSKATNGIC
jgi:transposase